MIGDLAQLNRREGGRLGRLRRRLRRPGLGRTFTPCRLGRGPLLRPVRDLGQRPPGRHRGVDLGQGVALARHGEVVLFLQQQPVVAFGRLAPIALQPDQRPFALQPLAVKDHLDLTLGPGRLQVRLLRLPGSDVPHLHRAGAIVAVRDRALERSVIQRMILDLDRQPLDRRVARRRLGHGPGFQHSVRLDAEIIMQPGRRMTLDQIAQTAFRPPAFRPLRLRRFAEPALGLIGLQFTAHRGVIRPAPKRCLSDRSGCRSPPGAGGRDGRRCSRGSGSCRRCGRRRRGCASGSGPRACRRSSPWSR